MSTEQRSQSTESNSEQSSKVQEFFIHDKYVKRTLSRKHSFISFLKAFATDLYEILDLDTLQLANTSFIDEHFKQSISDLIYIGHTKGGDSILIAIIFEHKSSPDSNLYFQLLDYVNNYWKQSLREGKQPAPVALIVFYHGSKPWFPKSIRELFADSVGRERILKMQPDFEPIFVDLNRLSEEELLRIADDVYLLVMLNLLKRIRLGPTEALRAILFEVVIEFQDKEQLRKVLYEAILEGLKYLSQFRNFDYETAKQLLMESEVLQKYELELNEDSPIAPFVKWLERFWEEYKAAERKVAEAQQKAVEAEQKAVEAERRVFEAAYMMYKKGIELEDILEAFKLEKEEFLNYVSIKEGEKK